eukprot:7250796-Alexandrium_andersonii.AAC.1
MGSRPAVKRSYAPGDLVLFHRHGQGSRRRRENPDGDSRVKGTGRWLGPGKVVNQDGSVIWVAYGGKLY